jgi:hypothetical protein
MIFQLLARLGLDTTDFQLGAKKAESVASSLGKSLNRKLGGEFNALGASLAGMFTLTAARSFFTQMTGIAGEIKDMADLLEISTDEVQKLQKAAADAGQPFNAIVSAFQRIEQTKAKALTGDARASGIFKILGIDPSQTSTLNILTAAINTAGGSAEKNAASFELLGKKVSGLKLAMDELSRQGQINLIDSADLDEIDAAGKRLEEAIREMQAAAAPFATATVRMLTAGINLLNPAKVFEIYGAYRPDQSTLPDYKKRTPFEQFHIGLIRGIENPSMLGGSITDVASRAMGLNMSTQDRFEALPVPESRMRRKPDDYDPYFQFLKSTAESAKKTAEILEKTTGQ